MGRQRFRDHALNLLVLVSFCAVICLFFYNKLKTAESDLAAYKLAATCPSQENCRQKLNATILENRSESFSMSSKGIRLANISYFFLVSSEIGEKSIEISANPPSVGTPFDIGNVQVPPGTGRKFLNENFSTGETVVIEIWRDQVIFMYVESVVDLPKVTIRSDYDFLKPGQPTLLRAAPPLQYDIALPTTMHPILLHAVADRNFFWVMFFSILSVFAYLVFIFSERKVS